MRKQVEYDFRLQRVSAIDPSAGREQFNSLVNAYLSDGWELFKAETVTYEANVAYVAFHFVRYAEVDTESAKKKA